MSTITEELLILQQAKTNLSAAIAEKGVDVPSKFVDYGTAVSSIQPGVDPEPYIRMLVGFMQSQNLPSSSDGPTPEEKRLVTIPEEVTERVTIIGGNTFQSKRYLTHLSFPNAKKLWALCFADCRALSSLELPALEYIAGAPFGTSSSNYHIPISSLNIPNIKSIVAKAFGSSESSQYTDIMDLYIDNKTKAEITAMTNYSTWNLAPSCLIHGSDKTFYYRSQEDYNPPVDTSKSRFYFTDGSVVEENIVGEMDNRYQNNGSLSAIEFGTNVTSIPAGQIFLNCVNLASVTIPDSMLSIGSSAFQNCYDLSSIMIGNGLTSIGSNVFLNCFNLSSIIIPDSVTDIGSSVFYRCRGLTSITIPNSVTNIGNALFFDCSELTTITVDSNNPVYDSRNDCNAIIKTANNELIAGCKNTVIPNTVTSIGERAFFGCSGLTSITIPDSVTSIGDGALACCDDLSCITIPDSVLSIGHEAFYSCSSLSSITCERMTAPTVDSGVFGYELNNSYTGRNTYNTGNNVLKVPQSATGYDTGAWLDPLQDSSKCGFHIEYLDPPRDPNKTYLFKNDGTVIENDIVGEIGQTYMGNTTLSAVEVGRHVTSIGGQAFRNCTYINNVTIPDTVTDIKYNAFDGCQRLVSIEIPESVSALGSMSFKGCSQLSSINVPRAVRNIPDNVFNGCQRLSSIVLPDVLTGLGYQAFNTCYQLRSVEMPTSLSSIGNNVFCECSRLSSINLPNDLVKIGQSAFSQCSRLTAITIPASVTSIGPGAFYKCVRLSNMVFEGKTVADVQGITNYRWSTDISTIIHCTDADITS